MEAKIAAERRKLVRLAETTGLDHPDVCALSEQLDALILRWHGVRGQRLRKACPKTREAQAPFRSSD